MKPILLHFATAAILCWSLFKYGLPTQYRPATITSTYSVEFAAFALLAIAGACFVALKRMR